jgi:ubiquinone/menaquinone biosynthesis C-methylase UbiE
MVDVKKSWNKIAALYKKRYEISTDELHYGPLCPGENNLRLLGDIKNKKVIDLGCGSGQNAVALAKMGADVTAIDFSKGQIEQTKRLASRQKVKIKSIVSDLEDLSKLKNNSFDLAISACAIAYIKNINKAFKEAYRILKPGGQFILSEMNPLQYIIDENEHGVEFNAKYPYKPLLIKWDWEFDDLQTAPDFKHYVRPISQYFNTLVDCGFAVSKILEPESTLSTPHLCFSKEIMEEYPYIAMHIPITFIIVAFKK